MKDMETKTYSICEYDLWRFIEENLPNYHGRDDVLHNDIVSRYVNGEDMDDEDAATMAFEFESVDEAERWLDEDVKRLFLEAVEAAFDNGAIKEISLFVK